MNKPITWSNVTVKLGELKRWAKNPRKSTGEQRKKIASSISRFGFAQPILISPTKNVYDGHQRLTTLLAEHGKDFIVDARMSSRVLTDDEQHRLTLAINGSASGEWDTEILASWDIEMMISEGFNPEHLSNILDNATPTFSPIDNDPSTALDKLSEITCPHCKKKFPK